jgi:hypothetical protein
MAFKVFHIISGAWDTWIIQVLRLLQDGSKERILIFLAKLSGWMSCQKNENDRPWLQRITTSEWGFLWILTSFDAQKNKHNKDSWNNCKSALVSSFQIPKIMLKLFCKITNTRYTQKLLIIVKVWVCLDFLYFFAMYFNNYSFFHLVLVVRNMTKEMVIMFPYLSSQTFCSIFLPITSRFSAVLLMHILFFQLSQASGLTQISNCSQGDRKIFWGEVSHSSPERCLSFHEDHNLSRIYIISY